jgi:hypothetical protein
LHYPTKDEGNRTEEFQPAIAGEFLYGTYQTFALQMRLGAQPERALASAKQSGGLVSSQRGKAAEGAAVARQMRNPMLVCQAQKQLRNSPHPLQKKLPPVEYFFAP